MEEFKPKVQVQGVPRVFNSAQQLDDTPTPSTETQNGLDEFLTFDAKPNGVTHETENMEAKEEDVETTDDENVDVVFEVNGQKINASMSASMAQMLKENEEMRLQVIDKIMAEAGSNMDQQITLTTEPSSQDTSATDTADSPSIKTETGVAKPQHTPINASTVTTRTDRRVSLGKRPLTAVAANNTNKHQVVTRGSVGTVKPKYEPRFVPSPQLRPTTVHNKVAGSPVVKSWDQKAVLALFDIYKTVNEQLAETGASRNVDMWYIIGKRMRVKGFQFSDIDCKNKINAITLSSSSTLKMKKKGQVVGKAAPRDHRPTETVLADDSPAGRALNLKPRTNTKRIPVITVEDDSPGVSDTDGFEDDEDPSEPTAKKVKTDLETTPIDKFRRTYLRVETEKLKEMKAARALQQEQCKLQKERNEILNTIATLLSLKK